MPQGKIPIERVAEHDIMRDEPQGNPRIKYQKRTGGAKGGSGSSKGSGGRPKK